MYLVLQYTQDATKAGIPGILYGRYEGDHYAGGNPWILLSASLAELLYNAASEMRSGFSQVSGQNAWASVLGFDLKSTNDGVVALSTAMAGAGDGVLMRIRHYTEGGDFHLAEQLDRNTGASLSAADLTWSYAATLKAVDARKKFYKIVADKTKR